MSVYVTLIALCAVFDAMCHSRVSTGLRKAMLGTVLVYMAIIAGFRQNVGADYTHYVEVYDFIVSPDIDRNYEEIGFRVLCHISDWLGFGIRAIFIVAAILLSAALYYFIVNIVPQRYWMFFMFLFVCGGLFFSSLNLMRQYMALSFALIAYVCLVKHRYVRAVIMMVLGTSMHRSVLIVLLLLPLCYFVKRNRNMTTVVLYAACTLLAFVGIDFLVGLIAHLVPAWSGYGEVASTTFREKDSLLKVLVPTVVIFYGLRQRTKLAERSSFAQQRYPFTLTIASGTLLYGSLSICFSGIMVLTRLTEYFAPFYFVFACLVLEREPTHTRPILYYLLYIYYIVLTIVTIFMMNGNQVLPYAFAIHA